MSNQQVETGAILTAKRQGQGELDWAESHIDAVLNGGSSTQAASGSTPYTHTVVWSKDNVTHTSVVTSYVSQADADSLAEALKTAIEDARGTIISG